MSHVWKVDLFIYYELCWLNNISTLNLFEYLDDHYMTIACVLLSECHGRTAGDKVAAAFKALLTLITPTTFKASLNENISIIKF